MKHIERTCVLIMLTAAVLLAIETPRCGMAQTKGVKEGTPSLTVERIKVHGKSLEGNLAEIRPIARSQSCCRLAMRQKRNGAIRWSTCSTAFQTSWTDGLDRNSIGSNFL